MRGALLALVLGLAVLVPIRGAGARVAEPDALILSAVGAFQEPTYVASPFGDQDRLFVVQKGGVIRLVLDVFAPTRDDWREAPRVDARTPRWP